MAWGRWMEQKLQLIDDIVNAAHDKQQINPAWQGAKRRWNSIRINLEQEREMAYRGMACSGMVPLICLASEVACTRQSMESHRCCLA